MLDLGYTLVYVDSAPLMGSPKSVALWQRYYEWLRAELKLAPKANLEGMSRGGLYTTNWAFQYPDEVATCLLYTSPSPRDRTRSRMPSSA